MMPRLVAEEERRALSIALAAGGRMVEDDDLRGYMRELADLAEGGTQEARKAPRITLAQAQALGLRPPDETTREEVKE